MGRTLVLSIRDDRISNFQRENFYCIASMFLWHFRFTMPHLLVMDLRAIVRPMITVFIVAACRRACDAAALDALGNPVASARRTRIRCIGRPR